MGGSERGVSGGGAGPQAGGRKRRERGSGDGAGAGGGRGATGGFPPRDTFTSPRSPGGRGRPPKGGGRRGEDGGGADKMVRGWRGEPIQYGPLRRQKPIPGAFTLEAPAEARPGPRSSASCRPAPSEAAPARSATAGGGGFPGSAGAARPLGGSTARGRSRAAAQRRRRESSHSASRREPEPACLGSLHGSPGLGSVCDRPDASLGEAVRRAVGDVPRRSSSTVLVLRRAGSTQGCRR